MGAVHEVVRKSNSGSTKRVELVYFEITNPKTYASYVLLKNFYWENDDDNITSIANRMKLIGFSRRYLTNIQEKEGSVTCTYCNKPNLVIELQGMKVPNNIKATIDHIMPISKGGGVFDESNITPCCGKCNSKKGSLSVEEFLKTLKPIMENYLENIGKRCTKKRLNKNGVNIEAKPFKSGFKINTIKGVIPHPQLEGQMAYTFEEDESYVETRRCVILSKKDLDN